MYLFFDTETTGLPRNWKAPMTDLNNWPRLVQLAYLLFDKNGNKISGDDHIIKPNGFTIPADASKIHGISTEKANKEGKELLTVLKDFQSLINQAEHLVAHNMSFDEKIVGYQVAETMEAIESIAALQMALAALDGAAVPLQLTHHSDRGIQYCSGKYVKLLQDNGIKISMTENGDPLENAIAERVNGIIKEEYLETYDIDNIKDAKGLLTAIVGLYNSERPHMSIGNFTPNHIHQSTTKIKTEKLWKNYYRKQTTFVNSLQD